MPTGNLPAAGKAIFEKVYESAKKSSTCKDAGDRMDECAARVAWTAVHNAGWKKVGDAWVKSADLEEFSLTITKAAFDNSQRMRWTACTSDIDDDSYGDNMTLELFEDFVGRIQRGEIAPEPFQSEFWKGGMPYLSVSHYPDLNGKAVPGMPDKVYIDGKILKSTGEYYDTPLGRACFKAAHKSVNSSDAEDKVRISIAFLDWMHKHKSTGYIFERKDLHDFCPECLKELLNGEYKGRTFLKGQLVHLAQTKVPVNKRTEITAEVERAMSKTRKEDAASIIGEELADELEQEAKLVGKSEALIIKSDKGTQTINDTTLVEGAKTDPQAKHINKPAEDEKYPDCKDEKTGEMDMDCVKMHQKKADIIEEPEEVLVQEAVMKKEGGCEHPSSHFLVVENPQEVTSWHLRFKNCSGEVDNRLLGAAKAALTSPGGHRGNKYEGPGKEGAISKLKGLYKRQKLDWEGKSEVEEEDETYNILLDIKSMLTPKEVSAHPLDTAFAELKSEYDKTAEMEITADEKLQLFQQAFSTFGNKLAETMRSTVKPEVVAKAEQIDANAKMIAELIAPLAQKVDLLMQMQQSKPAQSAVVPERRSINPALVSETLKAKITQSPTPTLHAMMNKSVGLPENS